MHEQKVSIPQPPGITVTESRGIWSPNEIEIRELGQPEKVVSRPLNPQTE